MILDKCEICGLIYPTSGFFPPGEEAPEALQIFSSITEEKWAVLVAADPRCRNTCGYCTVAHLKELKL